MLFRRVNGGTLVDPDVSTEVVKYCNGELKNEFGLDTTGEPKPVVGTDDLVRLLTFHWALDTSTYPTEDDRLDMATLMLFQSYTGCRPAELVHAYKTKGHHDPLSDPERDGYDEDADETDDASDSAPELDGFEEPERVYKALCYEDICLWVVQNPRRGERDLLAMEVTLRHHKGADNKPKPTIFLFREHALPLLCPISYILARAIRDDAILVDGYTTAEPFFATNLQDPEKAFKVHWRPSLLKTPVFRRSIRCVGGFKKSDTEPFPYSSYALYVNRLGKLVGFEEKLTSYGFRRGTANAVDGAATEAVRNQVLRHNPNTGVFTAYLNQRVGFDVQNAVLEDPTDDGLTRAFTHMSIRCNPLAPMVVPREVAEMLPPDPMVIEWETRRAKLRDRIRDLYGPVSRAPQNEMVEEYDELGRQITSAKKSTKDALNAIYRKEWFFNSHNEIMGRQRDRTAPDAYVPPVVHHQLPERTRLQEALSDVSRDLPVQDIVERRVRIINLMVALAGRQEVQPRNRSQASGRKVDLKQESPAPIPTSDFDPFELVLEKDQCVFCYGNKRLTLEKRKRKFSRVATMMDHVEDLHLSRVTPGQEIPCGHEVCQSEGLVFCSVSHFKSHVKTVHKVSLRRPPYIAATINTRRPSCLPAHVSPTYQTCAERLEHQEAEAVAVQNDMDEQFARDVERSVSKRGEHSIIVSTPILVGG